MTSRTHAHRAVLCRYGQRGDQVKAVIDQPANRVIVYYRDAERIPRKRFFANDAAGRRAAKDWCAAFHEERERITRERRDHRDRPAMTHGALWEAYTASPAFADLRAKTQLNYRQRWTKWQHFRGSATPADETTQHHIDQFITDARLAGIAVNQVRQVLNVARVVYNWGQSRELVTKNALAIYRWKKPKDARVLEPEEYTAEELAKLLAALSPQDPRTWRAWGVIMLAGHHGPRANAALHLRKGDVVDGVIHWPAEWQKTGVELVQPLTWDAVAVLETARWWTERPRSSRLNYHQRERAEAIAASPWVFPAHGRPDRPYSYNALWMALRAAEERAGIEHKPYRALHGLRRFVAGEVADRTNDARLGMEWIGDRDLKQAKAYLKRRDDRLQRAADSIGGKQ